MDSRLKAKMAALQKTGRGKLLVVVKHPHTYAIHEVYVTKDGHLEHESKPLTLDGASLHDIFDLLKACEQAIQDGCIIVETDLPKYDQSRN